MAQFINAEEARQEATSVSAIPTYASYRTLDVTVKEAILTAIVAGTFTTTLSVSTATATDAVKIKDKYRQLGYAIDDSTTPGSWIIQW